ncbi:MAG: lasso peptide biosynthesis B2 protein [Gemmatimonadaceae bacterium]
MRLLKGLARQSASEWSDLVEAQIALIVAQVLVWTRPVGRFVEDVSVASPGLQEPLNRRSRDWRDAYRMALQLRRAADHGIMRPKCLVRSVALSRMLDKHGIYGSRVRVGVRRLDGEFAAHAWVELGQHVLGDDIGHVAGFAQLVDVQLLTKDHPRVMRQA